MSDGLIVPKDIPIPKVKPEDLRTAADALEDDGDDISQAGQDIKMSWQGLEGIYDAPESETLFKAINPVATKGDDVDYAVGITVHALRVFANDAERLKAKLQGLKADAKAFTEEVKGDDDWREDEDKVNEHNTLNNDILAALHEYQEAERTCANTITAQFNGTTFVPADPGDEQPVGKNEKTYGTAEALEDVKTPWAKPQDHDGAWYEGAYDATKDFVVGIGKEAVSAIGVYGEDGLVGSPSEWGENLDSYWTDTLKGVASLAGFDGENGWMPDSMSDWGSTARDGWEVFGKEMVAWDEWDDRPGYAATQSVLNIGSTFLGGGAVKALSKTGRTGEGDGSEGSNGDSGGDGNGRNGGSNLTERLKNAVNRRGVTPRGLRQALDQLNLSESPIVKEMKESLEKAKEIVKSASPFSSGPPVTVGISPDNVGSSGSDGSGGSDNSGSGGGSGGSDGSTNPSGSGGTEGNGGRPDGDGDEVGDQGDPDRGRPSTPEQRNRQEPPGSDRDGQDDPSGGRDRPDRPNDDQTSPLPDPKNTPEGDGGSDSAPGSDPADAPIAPDDAAPDGDPTPNGDTTPDGDMTPDPADTVDPDGGDDPGSPDGPEGSPDPEGESFPNYDGPKYSDLEVPQGLTRDQFTDLTNDLRSTVGHLGGEIVVQGSRATGLAKDTSDIDIGIRIDPDRFDEFVSERFGSPNPGSAKEKTMLHAVETGKIQAGEAGLRALRKRLEAKLGMEVDVSILSKGGQFDKPPFIKVDEDA